MHHKSFDAHLLWDVEIMACKLYVVSRNIWVKMPPQLTVIPQSILYEKDV